MALLTQCRLLNLLASQLAAGCINIRSLLQTGADAYSLLFQRIEEGPDRLPVTALILAVLIHRIIRNQIYVDERSPFADQFGQLQSMFLLVVHVPQQNILQRRSPLRLLQIVVYRAHQLLDWNRAIDLHDAGAKLIVRRMQGNGQIHLKI